MLKVKLALIFTVLAFAIFFVLSPNLALAQKNEIQCGVNSAALGDSCKAPDHPASSINKVIERALNILSSAVGIAAVIMIIIGGFRYVTSGGSAEKVSGAKNTIIYAVIGLIIVALAQVIVRFVLKQSTGG